jgi:hypothetical protein
MIYQTDPEFAHVPTIAHGACYFLSILRTLSDRFSLPFTHASVLDFFARELGDGDNDVDNELFIGDPQNLIDDYVGRGRVLFLGRRGAYYTPEPNEIAWGRWHRAGTDFSHFTLGTTRPVIYDPWHKDGSASVAQGVLMDMRVARVL